MLSLNVRRNGFVAVLAPGLLFGGIAVLAPSPAGAHFKITDPSTPPKANTVQSWMSQDTAGGPQKNGPCAAVPNTALGDSPGTPVPNSVTVVQPGQQVTVPITVTIAHPGWFRIALVEGPSSSQTLATLADPKAMTGTNCTPPIMANPVWSPTQPILADGLPAGSTAKTQQSGTKTFQVTIPPTASCTSAKPCTLQAIMVMTDHPAGDCYYHHCADISIASATTGGGGSTGAGGSVASGGSGGAQQVSGAGGSVMTGGGTGVAGAPGTVGTGVGGSMATSGTGAGVNTGAAGSIVSGGSAGTNGAAGQPGGAGTGSGGSAATGSGASTEPTTTSGSSGCSYVLAGRGGASWAVSAAGLLALVIARRRRRPR